jgi:alkylation response protein AidB-like acyl-CoA dehydrogenase
MDVLLSEEEQMLKNLAREFLEGECQPDLVRAMETDSLGYPPALWKQMAGLGWLGLALPEKYDGQGASLGYLGIILEEVGRAVAPVPFHSTIVPTLTIGNDGTEEQCQEILPRVSRGDLIITWALLERDPRYIPEAIKMEAYLDGDSYVINGTKLFVENFNVSEKCLVVCRTAPASSNGEGISLFLVDTNSHGISHSLLTTFGKDKQSNVVFDQVRVPKENLIGGLDQGWPVAERMLERATALICSQIVGAARKSAELGIEYAKNRLAFGRPIGAFQSIAHMCADMIIWVDGAQLLTQEALWKLDHGLPAATEVSAAKAFCNDRCEAVVRSSNIIHGGIAFMREFNLNLWFRQVSVWTMRLGTSFEHRAKVAQSIL